MIPLLKLADGIFLSAWWTPQEACVLQFQIRSTSKTPAFSTVLVYLCIILGTCTSVFRSVAKSWCLINVAILMHTKEHPPQISPQKKTYCPTISSTCHGWPPAQWLPKPSTTHQEEGGIGDPTNTLARISWDSSVSLVFPQGQFPLRFSCETTHGEKSFKLVICMEEAILVVDWICLLLPPYPLSAQCPLFLDNFYLYLMPFSS